MAFSNEIIIPSFEDTLLSNNTLFKNTHSSNCKKSKRVRECFKCNGKININDEYINHQFRYDKRIITLSFHKRCF